MIPDPIVVLDKLFAQYGRPAYDGPDDLMGVLVRTILSQQTTRANCDRAFGALLDSFGADWARVENARADLLAEVVSVAGLASQKARRIQALLERVRVERGEYSLEFLRECGVDQARDYLTSFDGVGPKTAAFTLMYAAGMAAFPMDTHILRLCRRLGWTDESTSSARAHELMERAIPAADHYAAHMVMVRHGRQVCHARTPECADCPILSECPAAQEPSP